MIDFRSPDHNPEGCAGCRPVVFDPQTHTVDARLTRIAEEVFDASSAVTKQAWHRVTCLNSRDPIDVNLARSISDGLQKRLSQ